MSVRTRQCFLIDSLLENVTSKEPNLQKTDPDETIKRSPSTSSPISMEEESEHDLEEDEEEEEEEDGELDDQSEETEGAESTSRLSQLISNMMERKQDNSPGISINNNSVAGPYSDNSQPNGSMVRPLLPTSQLEYLSKLQMMQHALHLSSLVMRPPYASPLIPMIRKDGMFPRPMPLMRPMRAAGDVARGNIKKYRCDVCEKTFSRSNTLITHKRIHTGEKPFKCDHCGRAFRQPGNLTRHRLTHTTVKPYVCNHCDKAFNRASNLHTHMRTHSGK